MAKDGDSPLQLGCLKSKQPLLFDKQGNLPNFQGRAVGIGSGRAVWDLGLRRFPCSTPKWMVYNGKSMRILTLMIKWGTPILGNPKENGTVNYDICVDDPCINMYNEDGTCLVDGRVFSTHLTCVLQHFNWNFTVPIVCFVSCRFRYTSDMRCHATIIVSGG